MKHIPKIPKLIWHRLPYIALYSAACIVLLFVIEFIYYRYTSAEHFIHYTSFHFNSIEEHKDAPFEACKTTNFAYKIDGDRKIYQIPEGKTEIDKVLVKTYRLDSIISKTPCVNAFITNKQFDFTAGNYQVYTTFNFTTKYGNRKSVTFKSNIFQVFQSHPATVDEIQKKIDELQKQIDLLKLQLQATKNGTSFSPAADTRPSSANQQPFSSTTSAAQTPPPAATQPAPTTPSTPPPTPLILPPGQGLIRDSVPILGLL